MIDNDNDLEMFVQDAVDLYQAASEHYDEDRLDKSAAMARLSIAASLAAIAQVLTAQAREVAG